MKKKEFSVGDIVQLKSGGPKMSVNGVSGDGESILCKWFTGSKLSQGYFAPETLMKLQEGTES